jgi:hypothetical protein
MVGKLSAATSQYRITVERPGLKMSMSIPMQDRLSEVLLRVHRVSDQDIADRFIRQRLARLDAQAVDTGSATLAFSTAPLTPTGSRHDRAHHVGCVKDLGQFLGLLIRRRLPSDGW